MKFNKLPLILVSILICVHGTLTQQTTKTNQNEADAELDVEAIVLDAIDYAQDISLTALSSERLIGDITEINPFALFPTPFPRKLFEFAQKIQQAFNLLYFRISNDFQFLMHTFEPIAKTNGRIRKMLAILKLARGYGIKQTKSIMLARSDYMCHVVTDKDTNQQMYQLKQVEMNAALIGGLTIAGRLTKVHRRTLWKAGIKATKDQVPDNAPDVGTAEVLYKAWQEFGNPNAIILILGSRTNRYGQRHIEYQLERVSKRKAKIILMPLPECVQKVKERKLFLNNDDHSLRLETKTVGVIYMLSDPYYSRGECETILLFERSTAILSPKTGLLLATQKKVQQLLTLPGMVEKYLPDHPESVPLIRSTFAGLWSLSGTDEDSQRAIKDAIAHPSNYVIKPNMEGGGHNFFDEELREKLLSFTDEQREAHILMQRLNPMVVKNFMVRANQQKPTYGEMTTELSIYGFLLGGSKGEDKNVPYNVMKGHLLRTKFASSNEGGVLIGAGVDDSPFLIP